MPSPSMLMAAAIIGLSISNAIFIHLYRSSVDAYTTFRESVAAASATAEAQNQAKLDEAVANTGEVAALYVRFADDIARGHVSRLDGMRAALRRCETLSLTTDATTGVDAPAADTGLGADALATAERLETDCAATTGQLIWLQHWTRKVCK